MSKKGKDKSREKRMQKKRAKRAKLRPARVRARATRLEQDRHRQKKLSTAAALLQDGTPVPDITMDEYLFWLCHGANYIASDEVEGTWDPLFEGIYEGKIPKPEDIPQTVMSKWADEFEKDDSDQISPSAKAVLAWSVSDVSAVRIYKHEAERRLSEKNPDIDAAEVARQPHNATVWGLMAEVKRRSLAAVTSDNEAE